MFIWKKRMRLFRYLFFEPFFFFLATFPAGLAVTRTFVVVASVVVVVVVVVDGAAAVVAGFFTALPDMGKVFRAIIKTRTNKINENECISMF